jgi:hypothetical protein
MNAQIEEILSDNVQIEFAELAQRDFRISEGLRQPWMVPPESPMPMRRQPTPRLVAPLRWSVWSVLMLTLVSLVRRSRYSLGYERD